MRQLLVQHRLLRRGLLLHVLRRGVLLQALVQAATARDVPAGRRGSPASMGSGQAGRAASTERRGMATISSRQASLAYAQAGFTSEASRGPQL